MRQVGCWSSLCPRSPAGPHHPAGVRTNFDFQVLHTASMPSGFCSKQRVPVAQPFLRVFPVWKDGSPHSKLLVGSLYLEPRPPMARPELCCPLLGWPALSSCLSPPCFAFLSTRRKCYWLAQRSMCGLEDIRPQILCCSRLRRDEGGDLCSFQVPLAQSREH